MSSTINKQTEDISEHMKHFGLCLLGKGLAEATFASFPHPFVHAMAVTRCGQGAEILMKARIAAEHPLLIFSKLPDFKSTSADPFADPSTFDALYENGQTVTFRELPNRLWVTTGHRIKYLDTFNSFANLRNSVTHFAAPEQDFSLHIYRFIFEVIEPMVKEFYNDSVINYCEQEGGEEDLYVVEERNRLILSGAIRP